MLVRSTVVYLVFFSCYVSATSGHYRGPRPSFTAYKPSGLKISIPDESDIREVIFYVDENKGLNETYKKCVAEQIEGRWTFDLAEVEFNEGDVVYYRVYVQKYDRGYLFNGIPFIVGERETRRESATPPPTILHVTTPSATTPLTMASLPPTMPPLDDCSVALNTALEMMSKLQIELKSANNDLEILKEIASSQPLYLHMSGSAVQEGDPKYVVEFMIFEKLHTNLKVKDAWRNGTSITFELPALEQKLEVLRRVKTYMKDSKNVVITV